MEQTRAYVLSRQEAERKRLVRQFIHDNKDLAHRFQDEEVALAFDTGQDLMALALGGPREAVSFSVDGELYLRADIDTNKLRSVELYHFSEHLQKESQAFRVIASLLCLAQAREAHSVTVLPPAAEGAVPLDGRVSLARFAAVLFPVAPADAPVAEFEASLLVLLEG